MDGFKGGQDSIVQRFVHDQLVATAARPAAWDNALRVQVFAWTRDGVQSPVKAFNIRGVLF